MNLHLHNLQSSHLWATFYILALLTNIAVLCPHWATTTTTTILFLSVAFLRMSWPLCTNVGRCTHLKNIIVSTAWDAGLTEKLASRAKLTIPVLLSNHARFVWSLSLKLSIGSEWGRTLPKRYFIWNAAQAGINWIPDRISTTRCIFFWCWVFVEKG